MANNCTTCGKPIRLIPSAAERAKKDCTGKTAAYYENLFTQHIECTTMEIFPFGVYRVDEDGYLT